MTSPPAEPDGPHGARMRLIQAATEAFLEEGYRVSVDKIVARAGVAKQTLYNQFASKDELFREVGKRVFDALAMELDGDKEDIAQSLINFGLALRAKSLSDRGIAIFRSFITEGSRVPELVNAIHEHTCGGLNARVAQRLSKAMDAGKLRQDDPGFAAEMLIAMLTHTDRMQRLLGVPPMREEEERQRVARIVECFLHAFDPTNS